MRDFDALIEAYTAGYSRRGRQNKVHYLHRWQAWAEKHQIDPTSPSRIDLDKYRGYLLDVGGMPRSINSHLSVLRSWCRWMVEERLLETDPSAFLKNVDHPQQVVMPWINDEQTAALLDHVDSNADPVMRGLIYVMVHHGSRPQETRLINQGDISLQDGSITFRLRKNGGTDQHSMPEPVIDAVRPLLTGSSNLPLFMNENTGERLSKSVAQNRFRRLVEGAGIPRISMYGLRASFATNALDAGVSLRDVSYAMGHVSLSQTEKYDQRRHVRASIAQKAAAERIALLRVA